MGTGPSAENYEASADVRRVDIPQKETRLRPQFRPRRWGFSFCRQPVVKRSRLRAGRATGAFLAPENPPLGRPTPERRFFLWPALRNVFRTPASNLRRRYRLLNPRSAVSGLGNLSLAGAVSTRRRPRAPHCYIVGDTPPLANYWLRARRILASRLGTGRLVDHLISERHPLGVVLVKPDLRGLLKGEHQQVIAPPINPDLHA